MSTSVHAQMIGISYETSCDVCLPTANSACKFSTTVLEAVFERQINDDDDKRSIIFSKRVLRSLSYLLVHHR